MCRRGIEATDTTYTALISAYAKAERLEDALATYKIMASTSLCLLSLCMCVYVCLNWRELGHCNGNACHITVSGIACVVRL